MSEAPGSGVENVRHRFERLSIKPVNRFIVQAAVLLLYFITTAMAGSRQLWHDELYTYYIAKAPTLSQLFQELQLDLNPPLEYLAVRASLTLFGDSAYATRLPSIVGFLIGSLCFYRFVSKRLGWAYGVLGTLAFWSTPFLAYATEARPYALVVGWFGITMLAWEQASKPGRSKASILWLAAAVTGMMLSHIFAMLYIAPFCLAEVWRLYRTRRIDWAMWAAFLAPALIPLLFVKLMARFEASLFPPIFEASPRKLAAFYYHTLLPESPALAIAIGGALLAGFRSKRLRADPARSMTTVEIVFTTGLLAIPEIVTLVLMKTHGAFFPRYAIVAAFGYALVVVFGIAQFTDVSRLAAAVGCSVLFLYDAGAIGSAYKVHKIEREWPAKEAAMQRVRPDLPIVAASGLTFLEMGKYAMPATAQRLYYLTDRELAIRYAHATIFQDFATLKKHFPMRGTVEGYGEFVSKHRQFLVFGTPEWPEDWLIRWLWDKHAKVQRLGSFGGPYKDYQLFEVTMPSRPGGPGNE